jgi:signal peptidase II
MRHAALFFAVALGGGALDLLTKELTVPRSSLVFDKQDGLWRVRHPSEETFIPGFFSYGRTLNPGIIFGGFTNARTLWKWVSVLAVPAILAIFFSVKKPKWILTISLGMIMAGTIGNMYDRLAYDAVRDFIKFYVRVDGREKVWPLFNLADSFICVGVFLLTIEMLFFDEKKKRKDEAAPVRPPSSAPEPPPAPSAGATGP